METRFVHFRPFSVSRNGSRPLFQRPYVWSENGSRFGETRVVAQRLLNDPAGKHAPHFLGAVVLQQVQSRTGELPERVIIDGQQRLTIFLIDAIDAELRRVGAIVQADRLEYLIENDKRFRKHAIQGVADEPGSGGLQK
jgi:hypothetical protein